MELSKKDRLALHNQYEILKAMYPEDKEYYENNQKILQDGFKFDYDSLVENLSDDLPLEVSQFVWDVLQMYRTLYFSYNELTAEEKQSIKPKDIEFRGFDGNEESQYYNYADFIINDLKRYQELSGDGKFDVNSHWPQCDIYSEMLERWVEVREKKYEALSLDKILTILGK